MRFFDFLLALLLQDEVQRLLLSSGQDVAAILAEAARLQKTNGPEARLSDVDPELADGLVILLEQCREQGDMNTPGSLFAALIGRDDKRVQHIMAAIGVKT